MTIHCQLYSNISQILLLYETWQYYNKFDYEIIGGKLPMCQNTTMRVNGAWIKGYCILFSKTYNTLHSCHNFPAVSRQATRGARICEMSLLWWASSLAVAIIMTRRSHWSAASYDMIIQFLCSHNYDKTTQFICSHTYDITIQFICFLLLIMMLWHRQAIF